MDKKQALDIQSVSELLEKQNEKLKNDLKNFTQALQTIKNKQKAQKPPQIIDQKEDNQIYTQIAKYKHEIAKMQKELERHETVNSIVEYENRCSFLTMRIEELMIKKESLKKCEKMYKELLNDAQSSNTFTEKIGKLRNELRKNKDKYKELVGKMKSDEKVYKNQHERCVDLEEKCRKLWEFIKAKKKDEEDGRKKKGQEKIFDVEEEDVRGIKDKIRQVEEFKYEEEQRVKSKLKELETEIYEGRHNLEMVKIKLKEKDQECRLSFLKIKELKKESITAKVRSLSHKKALNKSPSNFQSPKKEAPLFEEPKESLKQALKKHKLNSDKLKLKHLHQESLKAIETMNSNLSFIPEFLAQIKEQNLYEESES
jgi:hypothetical protein